MIDVTVDRDTYINNFYQVSYYDRDTGKTLAVIQRPSNILRSIRATHAAFVYFVGGNRPTKTYQTAGAKHASANHVGLQTPCGTANAVQPRQSLTWRTALVVMYGLQDAAQLSSLASAR